MIENGVNPEALAVRNLLSRVSGELGTGVRVSEFGDGMDIIGVGVMGDWRLAHLEHNTCISMYPHATEV